ncbi:MAG TPA: DEAD/DEAH box helicase [Candidatus Angelobacter sp.]|nr:DEAD/DEAH box helicase [Candidatus Angelobacter sp.]
MISQTAQARFDDLYEQLIIAGVRSQIGRSNEGRSTFTQADLAFLLSVASRLALESEDTSLNGAAKRIKAYEIATRIVGFIGHRESALYSAARLILARLGNFPARQLLDDTYPNRPIPLPPYLSVEAAARQLENTIHIKQHVPVPLTDFQFRLWHALEKNRSLSVSAPTSAGKSYALSLDVVRRFTQRKNPVIVYLVPTRALIRQVMFEIIEMLNEHGLSAIPVMCVPEPLTTEVAKTGIIYVLTQERLHTLLYANCGDSKIEVDVLIVDEAQEISEGARGLVLETVIQRTLAANPRAAVFFSSPLRKNPKYLLNLFGRSEGAAFVEYNAPVSQTVISIQRVRGDQTRARIEVRIDDNQVMVDEIKDLFQGRGQNLPKIALTFTQPKECSILYANSPAMAEAQGSELAAELQKREKLDTDVQDLIRFVREHIHPKYHLADCLERGVGFHYGQMPQIVRARIEELLKKRALRFVCCTSTLLQGVNLPAKNIFLENPKRGKRAMGPGDFWNLAGRAGRLTKEFHGNVWCVFARPWEVNPLEGDRLEEITSAFRSTLAAQPERVLDAIKKPNTHKGNADDVYSQAFGRVFVDYHLGERELKELTDFVPKAKQSILQEINKQCVDIAAKKTLPNDVFSRNSMLSPLELEGLAAFLRKQPSLTSWIPVIPRSESGYAVMKKIFGKINEIFFHNENQLHIYYCWLANQWIRGASLKELIVNKLTRNGIPDNQRAISEAIRELFEELEQTVRFKYVKYLRAYNDVLRSILEARGDKKAIEEMVALHLLIEYGAWDKTLISLMSLGVSRTSAILLKSVLDLPDEMSRHQCQTYINELDLGSIKLPRVCKDEVRRLKRISKNN